MIVQWILDIVIFILCAIAFLLLPFLFMSLLYFLYFYIVKKKRPKKAKYTFKLRRRSFIKRVFFDFPKRFVLDLLTRDPDEFDMYGFHLFVGEQGFTGSLRIIFLAA